MIRVIEHLSADEPQTVIAYYPSIEGQAAEFGYSYGGGDSCVQRL